MLRHTLQQSEQQHEACRHRLAGSASQELHTAASKSQAVQTLSLAVADCKSLHAGLPAEGGAAGRAQGLCCSGRACGGCALPGHPADQPAALQLRRRHLAGELAPRADQPVDIFRMRMTCSIHQLQEPMAAFVRSLLPAGSGCALLGHPADQPAALQLRRQHPAGELPDLRCCQGVPASS